MNEQQIISIAIDERGLVFQDYSTLELIAKKIIDSGISKAGNTAQVCLIILRGRSLGLDMFESLENIHVINNKTCLSGDLAMALVEQSGLIVDKSHEFKGEGKDRSCVVTVQRKDRKPKSWGFSMPEARIAGLLDKKMSPWITFPDSMLYYRALGFALRREFPDVLRGMHLAEEFDRLESPVLPQEKPAKAVEVKQSIPLVEAFIPQEEATVIEKLDMEKPQPDPESPQAKLLAKAAQDGIPEDVLIKALSQMKHVDVQHVADIPDEKAKLFFKNWGLIRARINYNDWRPQ